MNTNIEKIKSTRHKSLLTVDNRAFTQKIADICDCSARQVQYVMEGKRMKRGSELSKRIVSAIEMYQVEDAQVQTRIKMKLTKKTQYAISA